MKLNLGCGKDYKKGYINVDTSPDFQSDYCHDLNIKWPWSDDTVEYIFASHIIEHIHNIILFMNEAYRVLKSKGQIEIKVPHYLHPWAYGDPSHVRFMGEESFYPFSIHADRFIHLHIHTKFRLIRNESLFDNERKLPGEIHVIMEK